MGLAFDARGESAVESRTGVNENGQRNQNSGWLSTELQKDQKDLNLSSQKNMRHNRRNSYLTTK